MADTPEQTDIDAATQLLAEYQGRSKFMLDLQGKSQRIDGFRMSPKQAAVVLTIMDEEHKRQQKQQDDSESPF